MFLLFKLSIGALMIILTVIIHAVVCDFVLKTLESHIQPLSNRFRASWKVMSLIWAVFMIGLALMADIWIWAFIFYGLEPEILKNFESALYFATVTFTTVGYGDIVLPADWRILAGSTAIDGMILFGWSTAIDGMILFGWSTAFIFEIMSKLYDTPNRKYGKKHD